MILMSFFRQLLPKEDSSCRSFFPRRISFPSSPTDVARVPCRTSTPSSQVHGRAPVLHRGARLPDAAAGAPAWPGAQGQVCGCAACAASRQARQPAALALQAPGRYCLRRARGICRAILHFVTGLGEVEGSIVCIRRHTY